jgi:hypothetical protein
MKGVLKSPFQKSRMSAKHNIFQSANFSPRKLDFSPSAEKRSHVSSV